ncbi:MAG: isocitrate lyase/phosphoenolpyruvate mutase family protein [Betaproteobacteria bacterium]|nr:isocitrate lyase/phosphoenolpyruvate mutase family protein [Betaproteobacteria bacterium]
MNLSTRFRDLHQSGLLVLPNAWDAGSARLMQEAGATAIATSSAALAWSNGWPDGDALPLDVLLRAVGGIARVISVPLTVDAEGGYSDDPATVAESVLKIADAGAVGINLEDGGASVDVTCAKIANIRKRLAAAGVDLFINLRTDVYLRQLAPEDERLAESLRRAKLYREAGADGLFVPLASQAEDIKALAAQPMPLNVMAVPGLPALDELKSLGARRLSAGTAVWAASMGQAMRLGKDFIAHGNADALFTPDNIKGGWMNGLFALNRPSA